MSTLRNKLIIFASLLLLIPLFSIGEIDIETTINITADKLTIKTNDPELRKSLIIGYNKKPIINPLSVSFKKLLENDSDYKIAQAAKKDGMLAKADIYEIKAQDNIKILIKEYAEKNNIQFIFEEIIFFDYLQKNPNFKTKTDEELREKFDITDDVIDYEKAEKLRKKEDEEKGFLEQLFSD